MVYGKLLAVLSLKNPLAPEMMREEYHRLVFAVWNLRVLWLYRGSLRELVAEAGMLLRVPRSNKVKR